MTFKQSLVVALVVCSLPQVLVGQDKTNVSQDALTVRNSQYAELQPQMFTLHFLKTSEVLSLLQEFGYHHQGLIAASPTTNQIIIRAPEKVAADIAWFIDNLEVEAQQQASQKQAAEKELSLQINVPSSSTIKWVGGDGGLTQSPIGLVGSFKAPGSNAFRLTNIPGHERLVVEARIDIPQIEAETAAVMSANLRLELGLSPSDLEYLAKGSSIYKFITGPHDLTPDQTELFGEVVRRDDKTLREGSPEAKGKGIVAVIHFEGELRNGTETGNPDPLVIQQLSSPSKFTGAGESKASSDSTVAPSDVIIISREFTAAENRVAELSEELSKLGGADAEKGTMLQKQLTEAVSSSFKLRQQLHQTQIDVQRAKLDTLERRVARRSESAQQIINQRIAEILGAAGQSADNVNIENTTSADMLLDGNVSIDYESETDIVTVRGKKDDVERTLHVIEKIKQQKDQATTKGEGKR